MKLKLRLLVAALALAAAGTASAQVAQPASSTGTDLIFYAFDSSTGTSYIQDLGTSLSAFDANTSGAFQINVAGNAAWTTYVNTTEQDSITDQLGSGSGYTVGTQNTQWAVVAGWSPGGSNASTYQLVTTLTNGSTPASQTLATARSAIQTVGFFTSALGNLVASAPTTGYFDANTTSDNPLVSLGAPSGAGTINGFLHESNLNTIGTSANFYTLSGSKTGVPTAYSNTFLFDGSNLTYGTIAAVPEPSSIMMMVAGLLMVAGVATRRKSK